MDDKPYIIDTEELFRDLRQFFKEHGWSDSTAYDVAQECLKVALTQ